MTIFELPLRNDLTWYSFKTSLSGEIFTLELRYNTRMQRWIMDIEDPSGNVILAGIPLLIQINLTAQYPELALPVGTFVTVDETDTDTQPTQYSFGVSNALLYLDPTQ